MPVSSSVNGATAATAVFPKLMRGPSGSVWLMSGPKAGTLVHRSPRAVEAIGYHSVKLSPRKLTDFTGELKLTA